LRGLLVVAVAAAAIFAADTALVVIVPQPPADVALTRAVQAVAWGPLIPGFRAVDWLEGVRQVVVAAALAILVLILNRPAFWATLFCLTSGAGYMLTELVVQRPRPSAELVHVVRHTTGYSYPSGHAVFFTWAITIIVLALLRRYLPSWCVVAGWALGAGVLALVCIGRVYDGEHWPTDIAGGLALGVAWTAGTLSVRRLGQPWLVGARTG